MWCLKKGGGGREEVKERDVERSFGKSRPGAVKKDGVTDRNDTTEGKNLKLVLDTLNLGVS